MVKRKEVLCVSIDSEVKEYLEKKAKEKGITLSEQVREIIYDHVIQKETATS